MSTQTVKVKIKIIADVDVDEFTPDAEELPLVIEETIQLTNKQSRPLSNWVRSNHISYLISV